jgi:hypothetical protein
MGVTEKKMIYREGGIIISKKNHACGGNEWVVARTGADIKLKCIKCKRCIFLSVDQVKKMAKTYTDLEQGGNND